MLAFVKRFLFFLLLAFLLLFGYQNLETLSRPAQFHFNFYVSGWDLQTPELPIVFLFVGFFLLGMIAAGFRGFYGRLAHRVDVRKRDRRIRELEQEVGELKARAAPREEQALPVPPARPTVPAPPAEDEPTL